MDFRDDEAEERYIRRVWRPMPVHPDRVAQRLKPLGFALNLADRHDGANEIQFLRESPGLAGLFDSVTITSNIHGEFPNVEIWVSALPRGGPLAVREYVKATRYGYESEVAKLAQRGDSNVFIQRLASAVPFVFSELHDREAQRLLAESSMAREAAERYLRELRPSSDLHETLTRLRTSASEEQWQESQRYVMSEMLGTFDLCDFRVIWDIAGLCQTLFWEFPDKPYRGLGKVPYTRANADDKEAHLRFQLVASRLARAPGSPIIDPLVPNRHDIDAGTPWRDGKPSLVAELFDEHLFAGNKVCACGKRLYYLQHAVRKDATPPIAQVRVRCNNGHEDVVEIAADQGMGRP